MKIRKFRKKDSDVCSKIIYDCVFFARKLGEKEKKFLKDFYAPQKIAEISRVSDFFVAQKNKKVVGTGRLKGEKIATLYVDPKYQRNGIGTLIINYLIKRARRKNLGKVYVESLLQSVSFYEKKGFKKTKALKKPVRALKMEKKLK